MRTKPIIYKHSEQMIQPSEMLELAKQHNGWIYVKLVAFVYVPEVREFYGERQFRWVWARWRESYWQARFKVRTLRQMMHQLDRVKEMLRT